MESTERKYIIPREHMQANNLVTVSNITVQHILRFLNENADVQYACMGEAGFIPNSFYQYMENALTEGTAKVLSHVYEGFTEMGYIQIPGTRRPKDNDDVDRYFGANKIVVLPEFNIAFATVSTFGGGLEVRGCIYIFATDREDVFKFNEVLWNYQKDYEDKTITEITDTSNGSNTKYRPRETNVDRNDVLIDENVKTEIFRMIDQFFENDGSFYKDNNIPYKRGLLMYGPPGNGKTTLIKSLINSIKFPIFVWQVTEYTNSEKIGDLFATVRGTSRPAVLIIEDLDSLPQNSRSTFLNTLDGITSNTGVFIIGTTNFPEKVDPALLNRAGRFDRTFEIVRPDADKRKIYLNKLGIEKFVTTDSEMEMLIKETNGMSMVTLNEIYTSIAIASHYDGSANIRKIVKDIKDIGNKQAKGLFNSEKTTSAIGFSAAIGD